LIYDNKIWPTKVENEEKLDRNEMICEPLLALQNIANLNKNKIYPVTQHTIYVVFNADAVNTYTTTQQQKP